MKKATKLIGMAVGATMLGTSGLANATTVDLGAAGLGVPLAFSGFAPIGAFIDTFKFLLPPNGGSGYSVVNFPLTIPLGTFNAIFSTLSLFSNPDGIEFNGDDALLVSNSTGGSSMFLTLPAAAGGNMYLTVAGITNGTAGGLYSGAISTTAALVPLPPAAWMLGSALVGLVTVGRRKLGV
ncbi:MAG: hypothetical protein EXR86_02470 [Gammaproteobacteria bacterium]|nr:hypothetical protein [Gammaproteobacteria bacterium]